MAKAIRAYEGAPAPRTTVYEMDDGTVQRFVGGSKAWRNNNPGNLRPSARHVGQIGVAWGMAVFADAEAGKAAMVALLKRGYLTLTLGQALAKYAPPFENPTAAYVAYVVAHAGVAGLGPETVLGGLGDEGLMRVVEAMVGFEKGVVGQIF